MRFAVCFLTLLAFVTSARSAVPSSIDPFYFMVGLVSSSESLAYIAPPQCEAFFRASGEQRATELFLDAARLWSKQHSSRAVTTHYYDPNGKRCVVENSELSTALYAFYARPERFTKKEWSERQKQPWFIQAWKLKESDVLRLSRPQRLSFIAGVHARSMFNGKIYNQPTYAVRAAARILQKEGCRVSKVNADTSQGIDLAWFQVKLFKVEPSPHIAQLFAEVDRWQPPKVKWAEKK
ncbi:MAG TPA: hypothetical protein VK961_06590 [Chthoniobacter sp.]|nr:hypothetical protein [Chthoniobacter sp.]